MGSEKNVIITTVILLVMALLFVAMVGLTDFVNKFSRELRYINNEINHTKGSANRYWRRRRRRLWFSLFPFVKYNTDEEEP